MIPIYPIAYFSENEGETQQTENKSNPTIRLPLEEKEKVGEGGATIQANSTSGQ